MLAAGRRASAFERLSFALHIAAIIFVALSIRLAYWQDARAYSIGADEIDYVIPAQTLVRDGYYEDTFVSHNRMWTRVPLTQLLFAGSFLFVPDGLAAQAQGDDAALMQPRYDALNIAQIILSIFTVLLIMLLAYRCFPRRARGAAILAGYIAAVYPPLASSPAQRALSEPLSITLIMAGLAVLSYWSPDLPRRRSLAIAAAAGVIFGVGALARSVAIAFVPLMWVWFVVATRASRKEMSPTLPLGGRVGDTTQPPLGAGQRSRLAPLRWLRTNSRPLVTALVGTLACLLAIAPWTYYNYRTYHTFLLLETANATAYWNYHNYRHENYEARLQALPDPADRLSMIVREGTANILEYPGEALRTTLFATGYMWHLESNSATLLNPWDMTQRDPDVPDLLHSDLIFFLTGLVGMAGFASIAWRRPSDRAGRTLLLVNLWLLGMILLGMVVPYDGRYRLPAAPSVIILASGLITLADWRAVFSPRRAWATLKAHPVVATVALVLCLWVVVGAYTPNVQTLFRTLYQAWRGDIALAAGDTSNAFGRYELAQQAFPNFYWPIRHEADMARKLGRDDQARSLYDQSLRLDRDDPYGLLGFADLVAHHSDWPLTRDEQGWLNRDETVWRGNPWNSVQLTPLSSIDIGAPGDVAFSRGFYKADRAPDFTYRWSEGRSTVRIPVPASDRSAAVTLRMSAPGIGPAEPLPVSISVDGAPAIALSVPAGWADYRVPIPAGSAGRIVTLDITSPTRTPSQLVPGNADNRHLGVGVDSVTLSP